MIGTNLKSRPSLLFLFLICLPCLSQERHRLLQSGPMIGYMDLVETVIWLQTTAPARVRVKYWAEGHSPDVSETITTQAEDFFIAKHILSDLEPGTTYQYRILIDDEELSFPYPLSFSTQKLWQWRTDPPDVRFALGSCLYINDPKFDRPGRSYGGGFEILDTIYKAKPDFMLWLGDNLYYRESDFYSILRMNYRMRHARSFPLLQPLLASMANYAIWDDHDYGPNDADRSYAFKHHSLKLFKNYWANPHFGMPDTPGVFGKMVWADLDFFFLDDRYYRAPNDLEDPQKPYLGKAQVQWLKDSLVGSRAAFKFIVIGNQMINEYSRYESYASYEGEYRALLDWISNSGVAGIIILSGDRHFTELLKLDLPHHYPLYELTSSPLTSRASTNIGSETNNPLRVPGTKVTGERNFAIIGVTGPRQERVLTLQCLNAKGETRWKHEIKRAELTNSE